MHLSLIGKMNKIRKKDIESTINKYPFFYFPLILKLQYCSQENFDKVLNSIALRHPKRNFLKKFLHNNNFNQPDFIDHIIKSQPKISKKKSLGEHKDDLSLRSINQKEFLTENIAKIYLRQKKIKDAIKIYEKLMSLNSKKKSYFAKKIEKLKK